FLNYYFKIYQTIYNVFDKTEVYDLYYIEPKNVSIEFPKKKRNLIYIYVESLENSELSKENGGYRNESIIPEIEELAINNLNFSHNEKIGGFNQTPGTSYTVGAIIGQTAGLPLITINPQEKNNQNLYNNLLKNAYSLGEILKEEGYKNYFMMGSDRYFADRAGYLLTHGSYTIFDYDTAIIKKYIPYGYDNKWWGFEDKKLYEYAKTKLKNISKKEETFNFTLLTVDTHPQGGYLDKNCKTDESLTKYENVFKCGSNMLGEFISWIQKQKFYKNTTIIITGDHLNMSKEGIHDKIPKNYKQRVLNVFLNPAIKTDCNKNREMTSFDMYPTTLAAIGAKIDGNRLGLGTNLFSCEKTISEEIGKDYFLKELDKNSPYYRNCLLRDKC
ncbi:MAG: LTA synthase family protein, partial [Bacilli bacterium]|nr:LTA synthase family protein [Bacilli bacterium]